ncbi:hypothetical protein Taro_034626 [Colocasia esculenta]|nr:hypothetical protein [Colocasia esculenta]
MSFRTC